MPQDTSSAFQDEAATAQNQERHIEELAGPDDYWLTITDAARATRRQDVSIRRWISKGLLPVKRQNVGLNQRTRLVRASDLAALTPIIDPSAAISTDLGRLDLTSIPVQQAQIKASQQFITAQMENLNDYVNKETGTLQQQLLTQKTALTSLQVVLEQHVTLLQASIVQQNSTLSDLIEGLRDEMQTTTAHIETLSHEFSMQLDTTREAMNQRIAVLTATFQEIIAQQQHSIDTSTAEIRREHLAHEQLSQHVMHITGQIAELHTQLEQESTIRQQLAEQSARMASNIASQQQYLEIAQKTQVQLQQQVAELQEQLIGQQQVYEQDRTRLVKSLTQQHTTQNTLSADLTSLTHRVQGHELHHNDYVKLNEQVEALERTMAEVRSAVSHIQEQGKENAE